MSGTSHRIRLNARLVDDKVVPRVGPNRWPVPVVERVRGLVLLADDEGARTSQTELVAALMCGITPTGSVMKEWVEDYRRMEVRATLLAPSTAASKTFVAAGSGRPRGT